MNAIPDSKKLTQEEVDQLLEEGRRSQKMIEQAEYQMRLDRMGHGRQGYAERVFNDDYSLIIKEIQTCEHEFVRSDDPDEFAWKKVCRKCRLIKPLITD